MLLCTLPASSLCGGRRGDRSGGIRYAAPSGDAESYRESRPARGAPDGFSSNPVSVTRVSLHVAPPNDARARGAGPPRKTFLQFEACKAPHPLQLLGRTPHGVKRMRRLEAYSWVDSFD